MKLGFITLGCDKNTVDSERYLAQLADRGAEYTDDLSEAEVIVINTCGFIDAAKKESLDAIIQAGDLKVTGACKAVVAVGCSQIILVFCNSVLGMAFVTSNLTAVTLSSVPSYLLNRAWVWGRTGSHDVLREVVPFWIFAFVGLAFSTLLVHLADRYSDATIVLSLANLTAFGILWIAKYLILDALLFSALLGDDDDAEEIAVV